MELSRGPQQGGCESQASLWVAVSTSGSVGSLRAPGREETACWHLQLLFLKR